MNRGKRPMTKQMSKRLKKEVHAAQGLPSTPATPKTVLKKLVHTAKAKKVQPPSEPDVHGHPEGARWIKTLTKQNLAHRKILAKKLSKNRVGS